MNTSFKLLLILFICSGKQTFAQDYTEYYIHINKAEELFVLKKDSSCFREYDAAFKSNIPFLKDAYIASQIAFYLGHMERFYNYTGICFSNGMPLTAIEAAPMFRKSFTDEHRGKIRLIHSVKYKAKETDKKVYEKVCLMCYQSDSIKVYMGRDESKIQQFDESENSFRTFLRDSLLKKGVFPNEHLIPISSAQAYRDFYKNYNRPDVYAGFPSGGTPSEYELRVACPFNILIHSSCFFEENKELLFEAVKKGYLHPKEFGILQETAIMWYESGTNKENQCPEPARKICYNIFGEDLKRSATISGFDTRDLETVESNRRAIFMQSYATDQQKKEFERLYGFAFFFDFRDRL